MMQLHLNASKRPRPGGVTVNRQKLLVAFSMLAMFFFAILPSVAHAQNANANTNSTLNDQQLRQYQSEFLDPQVEDAVDPQLSSLLRKPQPVPKDKVHNHGATTTDQTVAIAAAVNATADPSVGGSWAYLTSFPSDFNNVHSICSPTGKCLLAAGSGRSGANFKAGTFRSYIYNPLTQTMKLIFTPTDVFCSGHVLLPDGRALVTGGTGGLNPYKGTKTQYAFDFVSETYQRLPDMSVGRWYPSDVTMDNGKTLITSGFDTTGKKTPVVETFDYRTNLTTVLPNQKSLPNYPRTFQTSVPGQIFFAGPAGAGFWTPTTGAFKAVAKPAGAGPNAYASCFFGDVRDQNLMIMGGGWPAVANTSVIQLNAATPAYKPGPTMAAAKGYVSCVNLPDGTLFEANGGSDNLVSAASSETSLLTSLSGQWQPMAPLPAGEHRLYHSSLWVIDDGRVISMTSNPDGGGSRSTSTLVYSPPYLSKGTRPAITSAPTEVSYGGTIPVAATAATGRTITRITVTTAPSATHSTDLNQRYLSLPYTNGSVTLPTQATIMPPGWYRIWAVDDQGVPSVAKWIHIQ
jgi:hypothetical protein